MNTAPCPRGQSLACALLLGLVACGRSDAPTGDERGLRLHESGAFEGYTLIAPYQSTTTYLVDMDGAVVHRWESEHEPAGGAYLLDDGRLLRAADQPGNPVFAGGGTGGRLQVFGWEGELLWDYPVSDEQRRQNHDVEPLPNGNVLIVNWEYRSADEAIAAGRDPEKLDDDGFWPNEVLELEPLPPDGARVVWEWHAWDHIIQDFDPSKANHGDVGAHPELLDINAGTTYAFGNMAMEDFESSEDNARDLSAIGYVDEGDGDYGDGDYGDWAFAHFADWKHVNAISYEPQLDLIVLSSPHLNEVLVIDHSTTTEEAAGHSGGRYGKGGDVLYRWGNPQYYRAGDDGDRQLFYQHDARWLPGARLLVFNNGTDIVDRAYSSVDELVLPFDPERGFEREPGSAFAPAEPIWSYRAEHPGEFFSPFISGAQRLPNGNTLVCDGMQGRLFEITRDHRIVWEYWSPFGPESPSDAPVMGGDDTYEDPMVPQAAFRATRLAPDHPGLQRLGR